MVGDECHGIEAVVESLHHVGRLVAAGYIGGVAEQLRWRQVAHSRVRVVDHDLGGAPRLSTIDRRVDLGEQELAASRGHPARSDALLPHAAALGSLTVGGQDYLTSHDLLLALSPSGA